MIKAVIFDLGDTLLYYRDLESEDQEHHFRRVTQLGIKAVYMRLTEKGLSIKADSLGEVVDRHIVAVVKEHEASLRSETVETPIRAAFEELGAKIDDSLWEEVRPAFYTEIDKLPKPRPGLHSTLEWLKENGYALGIISNTFWASDVHDRHLHEAGIAHYFPVRVYSCDEPFTKPHASIYQTAVSRLGVSVEEAVYIGDKVAIDVFGAQQAGLRGALIRVPFREESFEAATPDAVLDDLPDLIPTLTKWRAEDGES